MLENDTLFSRLNAISFQALIFQKGLILFLLSEDYLILNEKQLDNILMGGTVAQGGIDAILAIDFY